MKIKFNRFERIAGLFVVTSVVLGLGTVVAVAIKQGWFESRIQFETDLQNADGVHSGTAVQMAGIRAGSVTEVVLKSGREVRVVFEVSEKYHDLIREDSVVRTLRPFVISDKVLDVTVGSSDRPVLSINSRLKSEASADIMDLISGKTLAPHLASISKMSENLRIFAEAILSPERTREMVEMLDEIHPLLMNMTSMSKEVSGLLIDANRDKKLVRLTNNLAVTTVEVNRLLPEMNKLMPALAKLAPFLAKDSPELATNIEKIAANMALLTDQLQETLPAIKQTMIEVGPEIPRATRRAMEALDETVVTLKALQKSFLLRSNTREVREEEAIRDKNEQKKDTRAPSSDGLQQTPQSNQNTPADGTQESPVDSTGGTKDDAERK